MINLLKTGVSRKEIECFDLIKHLGFVHNKNLIDINGYFPDYIHEQHKLLVEFYGDRFHANPNVKRFSDDDTILRIGSKSKTAKEIRDRDLARKESLENFGYTVSIIWEKDFDCNKTNVINETSKIVQSFTSLHPLVPVSHQEKFDP